MEEIWKPIPGHETVYEASSFGRIRAMPRLRRGVSKSGNECMRQIPERVLTLHKGAHGYLSFSMTAASGSKATGFLVHRVVASAFRPNPDNRPWVNHLDGLKTNNRADNLEWCTPKQNTLHAMRTGLIPKFMGLAMGTAKLNEDQVFVIKKMILLGFSNKELAQIFKVSTAPISYIRSNKAWTHVSW